MLGYRELAIVPLLVAAGASMLLGRPHMFALFAAALVAAICWDRIARAGGRIRIRCRRGKRTAAARIRISDLREDALVAAFGPLLAAGPVRRAVAYAERRIKRSILRSGSVQNPRLLGIRSVLYPIAACVVAVPAFVAVALAYGVAVAAPVLVPVPLLAASYFVMLRIRTDDRKAGVEDEIAPFASLASIMESVNVSLFSTFETVARSPLSRDIFPAIRNEGRRIRNITSLGRSPVGALMELADSHPSSMFRTFLDGYVSSFNTGGADTSKYLQEQSRRFFAFMQARMARYTKQADMIAQIILTVMLLLPMMGISMTFFTTGSMAETVMLILIMAFPFITVILIAVVHAGQPRRMDSVGTSWMVFAAGSAAALAAYLAAGMQIWEAAGIGIIVGSVLNMALVRRALSEAASSEAQLPEFMRQMTRFKNIGIDIMNAIRQMRREAAPSGGPPAPRPRFGGVLDGIIDGLYRHMAAGIPFDRAVSRIRIRSWNVRLVFFILGRVHESGGGTTKTLDDITRWVTEHEDAKKEMVSGLRVSMMTAFVGPVLMVMISSVSDRLSAKLESGYPRVTDSAGLIPYAVSHSADVPGLSEILTVVATACMGVTLSKINYFTVRHTAFVGSVTAVAMILLYVVPGIGLF